MWLSGEPTASLSGSGLDPLLSHPACRAVGHAALRAANGRRWAPLLDAVDVRLVLVSGHLIDEPVDAAVVHNAGGRKNSAQERKLSPSPFERCWGEVLSFAE